MYRFTLLFAGFNLVAWGLVAWTPSYLIQGLHMSVGMAALATALPWFVAAISTAIGGLLFDRYFVGRHRVLIVPSMLLTGLALIVMINAGSAAEFVAFSCLEMATTWVSFMPIFGLPLRVLPPSVGFRAAFSFLLLGVAVAIGAVLWTPQRPEQFAHTTPAP